MESISDKTNDTQLSSFDEPDFALKVNVDVKDLSLNVDLDVQKDDCSCCKDCCVIL